MAKAKRKEGPSGSEADSKTGESVNKMAAVKAILDEDGYDAKPAAILDRLRKKFNVDMSPAMVSNYKSLLSRKAASQSQVARQPRSRAAAPTAGRGAGITLNDVEAVKKLADRIGADNVRKLAEVLSS
jgi:hypothetical protein